MFDIRPILLVVGILLTTLGCAMMLPAIVDLAVGHEDWAVFAASSGFTVFIGVSLALLAWGYTGNLSVKQAFALLTISWLVLVTFAAIPLALSDLGLSYTNAFFESMSGLTTTGATVIIGLDTAPPGILLWRALLQWLGGIGIIVMAIAVLPMLRVGGMQMFKVELGDTSEKILPRATQIAGSVTGLYVAITIACTIGYALSGMRVFDSIAHALTTVSTGGFSTRDASLGAFDSLGVDMVAVIFMIIGGLPFVPILVAVRGDLQRLYGDTQVQGFLLAIVALITVAWLYQLAWRAEDAGLGLQHAALNVISVMTGTGYTTTDYGSWGPFAEIFYFSAMFVGGCAGSTSCGIKIFRFQVMFANISAYLKRIMFPHGVFVPRYNSKVLPDNVSAAVMSFFFLFILCFGLVALALNLMGLDNLTAMSAAASAINNVGPGLGEIVGPAGTYGPLPDAAKWVLSAAMLVGRLELFAVLVMLTPAFWRA